MLIPAMVRVAHEHILRPVRADAMATQLVRIIQTPLVLTLSLVNRLHEPATRSDGPGDLLLQSLLESANTALSPPVSSGT